MGAHNCGLFIRQLILVVPICDIFLCKDTFTDCTILDIVILSLPFTALRAAALVMYSFIEHRNICLIITNKEWLCQDMKEIC